MNRREGFFRGYDGTELFYQTWESQDACGTIVLTHGIAEHSECYQRLVDGMAPHGWSFCGWDLRGHGRSEGKRGYVKKFDEYVDDFKCLLEVITKINLPKPMFIVGHSMGGLITISSLIRLGAMEFKAAALSSPLLGIAVPVPALKDMAARFLKAWLPGLTLNNEIIYEHLTHDEQIYQSYPSDPLRHDRISISLYLSMIDTCNWALLNASKVQIPLLMQLAGNDLITSRKAAETFFERVGSQRKELKVYKGFYHEIFNEIDRETVYSDLNNFFKGFLTGP